MENINFELILGIIYVLIARILCATYEIEEYNKMPKLIKTWDELDGLESKDYKIKVEDNCSAWIVPKDESKFSEKDYYDHHVYLSTHTFYGKHYKESTEILQKYGFDVEIDNWDKE